MADKSLANSISSDWGEQEALRDLGEDVEEETTSVDPLLLKPAHKLKEVHLDEKDQTNLKAW